MEQMYLIEIFIDKVTIFVSEEDEKSGANKNLIIKIRFGPKAQFIIKEGQLALNEDKKDDIVECDDLGRRKWTRTIRVGKSYLFPSYPDTVLMILSKFPLEIEVWNDDQNEVEIFVGIGTMHWETEFYHMLKDTTDVCKPHEPLSIKQHTPLFAECCCKQVGEIGFILRLSALGDTIITEFQQLMKDPDTFVFRTNKAPSMFQCKRIEGDNPNFCMVGSLYETTTLEDPSVLNNAQKKIEVCTELQSCGMEQKKADYSYEHGKEITKKKYPINKIRMGDITGPCGNANCPLAHKVRTYIRNLEAYKQEAAGKVSGNKDDTTRKICGACNCKDDRWHRENCPNKDIKTETKALCTGCSGVANTGDTCEDKKKNMYGTGATPTASKTQVNYVFSINKVPDLKESIFGKDFIVENFHTNYNFQSQPHTCQSLTNLNIINCCCRKSEVLLKNVSGTVGISKPKNKVSSCSLGRNNEIVYNIELKDSLRKLAVYNCTVIPDEKDCKCNPPKPPPPCKTFDCECVAETSNIASRKAHKPYCPSYKHKTSCPVTMLHEEDDKKKLDDEEDEVEPLPYGLPPIKLGPCPVMGRPCTVPDGFARMYKTAALATPPPSYNDAGKICCSKEYERIKKAIKDYLKYEKDHDYRCINKFNVDTERRCCDKEQQLLSLMGKACCGSHKMSIQEKFKEDKK
ncbi:uncharacterized protein LOC131842820 isoform X1 [Achroia grisella]|uniref:uncharacterized protein LOC131842820 isoform X1 n=1 Tax=Achroia grisella TaxID=688607 RepID=UPI0027D2A8C0|nr:uncharacterized protein LOC131842820 isoform X1 [Achroia grisella]